MFLTAEEELIFQRILWVFMLYSSEWNYILSDVISSFSYDREIPIPTLKDVCSEEQGKAIAQCLSLLLENLNSKTYELKDNLNLEKEIELVGRLIYLWGDNSINS